MSKYEFLEQLKDYLTGQIPDSDIRGHLNYYRSYIENEVRNGRPEADVISELGDPRLLGKTMIDAKTAGTSYSSSNAGYSSNSSYNSDSSYSTKEFGHGSKSKASGRSASQTNKLWKKIKIIFIIALILAIIFFIVRFAVRLLIYILPAIIILAVISYFIKRR